MNLKQVNHQNNTPQVRHNNAQFSSAQNSGQFKVLNSTDISTKPLAISQDFTNNNGPSALQGAISNTHARNASNTNSRRKSGTKPVNKSTNLAA